LLFDVVMVHDTCHFLYLTVFFAFWRFGNRQRLDCRC
jgi:hypothetical protein